MPETEATTRSDVRLAETTGGMLREMMVIAIPAVVTMASYSLMQFVDKVVVARLGTDELAAVGNGGVVAFVPAAVFFGILSLINTFASQNLGAGRPERGSAYMWNGLWLTLFAYLFVFLPFAVFLPEAFALMRGAFGLSVPEAVTVMEVEYARILLAGMLFALGARGISNYFYGIHRPSVVMFATVTGNLVNFVFTIALVLGVEPLGIPALGVHGAAIATVIGSIIECSIPFALFVSKGYEAAYGTRSSWRLSRTHMKELIRLGLPAGLMWGNEVVCWWIFLTGFVATFDRGEHAVHNAAGWIVLQYMHLSFMPAIGFSIALSAVVGKCMGAQRDDLAHRRVVLGVSIAMAYMGLCALLFVVFRGPLVWLYARDQPPEVREEMMALGGRLLIVAAVFQVFDALAITLSGALRGAGDTLWPGVATIAACWTCMVGGGWAFVTYWPELGSTGPWIGAAAFIITLSLALLFRYAGGKWRTMSVVRPDGTPERPLPMPGPTVESDSHVV